MLVPLVISALWLLAVVCVLALCRGAKRGDEVLALEREHDRARALAAGIVVLDAPAGVSARDLRTGEHVPARRRSAPERGAASIR
jgi:hypothetical protein